MICCPTFLSTPAYEDLRWFLAELVRNLLDFGVVDDARQADDLSNVRSPIIPSKSG